MSKRTVEHTEEGEAGELATLSEEQENVVQLQQIAALTVEKGVMRLPVSQVTSTPSNKRWSIKVDHPVKGELFFNMDKPRTWTGDAELIQLMRWYGIESHDPYVLQTRHLYVEHKGDAAETPHGWELIEPPWMETRRKARQRNKPWRQRARDWVGEKLDEWKIARTYAVVWAMLLIGAVLPLAFLASAGIVSGPTAGGYAMSVVIGFVMMTLICIASTDPPGEVDHD